MRACPYDDRPDAQGNQHKGNEKGSSNIPGIIAFTAMQGSGKQCFAQCE